MLGSFYTDGKSLHMLENQAQMWNNAAAGLYRVEQELYMFSIAAFIVIVVVVCVACAVKGNSSNLPGMGAMSRAQASKYVTMRCPWCDGTAIVRGNRWECTWCGDSGMYTPTAKTVRITYKPDGDASKRK